MSSRIAGTAKECLVHYIGSLPAKKSKIKAARAPLSQFLGCGPPLAYRLFKNKEEPFGEYRIKLRYFLHHLGYTVKELRDLPTEIFELGNLVALNIISTVTAAETLNHNRDTIIAYILGRHDASEKSSASIEALVQSLKQEKASEIHQALSRCRSVHRQNGQPVATELGAVRRQSTGGTLGCDPSVTSLAAIIDGAIPLAKHVLEMCTPADRHRLRELVRHPDGVFVLSNLLNGLCSEHARNSTLKER